MLPVPLHTCSYSKSLRNSPSWNGSPMTDLHCLCTVAPAQALFQSNSPTSPAEQDHLLVESSISFHSQLIRGQITMQRTNSGHFSVSMWWDLNQSLLQKGREKNVMVLSLPLAPTPPKSLSQADPNRSPSTSQALRRRF